MTRALCLRCFAEKHGCWTDCERCGFIPHGEGQLALSLVVSDNFLSPDDLSYIRQRYEEFGEFPDIGDDLMEHAVAHVRGAEKQLISQGLLDPP